MKTKTFTIQLPDDSKYPLHANLIKTLIADDSVTLSPEQVIVTEQPTPYECPECHTLDDEHHDKECLYYAD